jgi:hypothetical protein
MNKSVNAPIKQANKSLLFVWFEGNGSSAVSVYEGQGVCYNWDYGTAASEDFRRTNRVELPTILNARYFAGVLARNYTIPSGGRMVEVYAPGSTCNILSKASTTIGVGILTCTAGGTYAGYWKYAGFEGEGSAVPLQTIDRSSTAGLCEAKLQEGVPSGLLELLTCTAGGATTMMVGGVTCFETATLASNATFTMAAGTIAGLKKKFEVKGTQTTSAVVVTLGGTALKIDGSTTLATLTMETIADEATLVWNGNWVCVGIVTVTAG